MSPLLNAAAAVTSLNVEPGAYWPVIERSISALAPLTF
ncbi:unannotated protein [freshwater metagenome]|uniref:Unannotated protein n=1 Tax=freshwater metagenome TaxID=449393 RepID=A0A6J6BU79_9ZZZZ